MTYNQFGWTLNLAQPTNHSLVRGPVTVVFQMSYNCTYLLTYLYDILSIKAHSRKKTGPQSLPEADDTTTAIVKQNAGVIILYAVNRPLISLVNLTRCESVSGRRCS